MFSGGLSAGPAGVQMAGGGERAAFAENPPARGVPRAVQLLQRVAGTRGHGWAQAAAALVILLTVNLTEAAAGSTVNHDITASLPSSKHKTNIT